MFQRVSPQRGFEEVIRQVRQAIVEGRLRPGDRLPSQREMKQMFQVSRATVLEALRVLEKADLLTIRTGASGGAFVSHATADTVAESLLLLLSLEGVSLGELAEFRERLEGGTAFWAAQRVDEEAIAHLEEQLARLRALADARTPWAEFLAEEVKFHWAVAEYSLNRPSVATMKAITRAMGEAYGYISPGLYDKVLSDIQAIFDAVRSHQPELAETRMKSHIAFFNDDIMRNRASGVVPNPLFQPPPLKPGQPARASALDAAALPRRPAHGASSGA